MEEFENVINNKYYREKTLYYVYIHTCPNNKCYIGISTHPKNRWNNGEGYKDNKDFYKDIKKYGWDNIEHEIVAKTYYGWVARGLEKRLISQFKKTGKIYNRNNEEQPVYVSQRVIPLKKVGKYSKEGELIKIYNSASEAHRDGNTCESNIQACCRGRTKTAGGFIWKYL